MEAPVYKDVPEYKVVTKQPRKGYEVYTDHDGVKWWCLNGQLHREDGPAVEWPDGDNSWYLNGVLHREDGPAREFHGGKKYWCLNGTDIPEEKFNEVWTCPLDRLPLYINTIYAPIAKRRLSNPKEVPHG